MFTEKLKTLREQRGLSQAMLSEALGVPQQTISNWETGRSTPNTGPMIALCEFFGVTMDYLFRDGAPAATRIPILQIIYPGMDIARTPAEPTFEEIPKAMAAKAPHFAFRLKADSLAPRFMPEDVAIFRFQETFEDLDIVAIQIDGELYIRQAIIKDDVLVLAAFNPHPAWHPIVRRMDDLKNGSARVIGVLVEVRARSFR